ncbi:MAG: type II toxin-antitoxin system RelE/ParE family toxin [Oscillospiraceae bacterium]|nr:type II toxin-antitoxin system RelE/ParE family toxin [Oscillospiraceae bacterium]
MIYRFDFKKPAVKFLEKQTNQTRSRILNAIYKLPDIGDVQPMAGQNNYFRLRVGDFRVIYSVLNEVFIIEIVTIGNRGDIYK